MHIMVSPPSDFSVHKNLCKNLFLKFACRTGCETAVDLLASETWPLNSPKLNPLD